MRLGEGAKMQASINVTPLVDVVLVLLIIFMVVAPNMRQGKGPEIDMPATAKPKDQGVDQSRILVTVDEHGGLWIDDKAVAAESLGRSPCRRGHRPRHQGRDQGRCQAPLRRGPEGHARDRAGGLPRRGLDRRARQRQDAERLRS